MEKEDGGKAGVLGGECADHEEVTGQTDHPVWGLDSGPGGSQHCPTLLPANQHKGKKNQANEGERK